MTIHYLFLTSVQGDCLDFCTEQIGGGGYKLRKPVASTKVAMAIAAGGLIKQTIIKDDIPADEWDTDNSVLINVQLIDAAAFARITGFTPLPSPITASTYAKSGYPFYSMYEEPSGIKGNFKGLKSIAEMEKGRATGHPKEKHLQFPVVALSASRSSFVPVSEMKARLNNVKAAQDL
jgi:hypothetical protein